MAASCPGDWGWLVCHWLPCAPAARRPRGLLPAPQRPYLRPSELYPPEEARAFLCLYSAVDAVSLLLQSRCRPLEHCLTCFAREPQINGLVGFTVRCNVLVPLFLSPLLSFLSCRHCPAPAVSGEPPPCGFGAAVIEAPGRAHIPQQQIWGKLAAEECERFRAL